VAQAASILLSLAGPYLAERYGWRLTFIVFALVGLGAACLYGTCAKDEPRSQRRMPVSASVFFGIVRFPILWVCSWLQFVRFAVVMGFNFWLPSFLVADRGFSLPAAGAVMAPLRRTLRAVEHARCLRVGPPEESAARDRLARLPFSPARQHCFPRCESLPALVAVIAVYSIFFGFYFGPLFLVNPWKCWGAASRETTIGFSNLFANIGGFVCVYSLGAVRDQSGSFAWGFRGIAALCLCGVVLAVVPRPHAGARARHGFSRLRGFAGRGRHT
jgi:DHA1 family inner membrane transport protein